MSKHSITRLFVGSLAGIVAGLALVALGGGSAFANDLVLLRGPDVVGLRSTPWAWVLLGLALLGVVVAVAAVIALLASWVAALVSTARMQDKTWFLVLLITGLFSLGLLGMVIYLAAGPDDTPADQPQAQIMAGVER